MPSYTAPVKDMQFLLHDVLKISEADIPGYSDLDRSFTEAVFDEAAKVAQDVLTPLNSVGDREGCVLENGVVRTPTGFKAAFDTLRAGGWMALDAAPEYGGQGLPRRCMLSRSLRCGLSRTFASDIGLDHGGVGADFIR